MNLEKVILKNLLRNESYTRKVLPFLKEEYFTGSEKFLYQVIRNHLMKYNIPPSLDALQVEIDVSSENEHVVKEATTTVNVIRVDTESTKIEWLMEATEKFCQDKAIFNAMMASIDAMNGKSKTLSKGAIPKLLSDALSVSFDPNVGHDYFEQYKERYEFYHRIEERVPFDLDFFNTITNGGFPKKSLNIFLAGTGVGKSLTMCHLAAACMSLGKNVLYITLELAEERIAERIDANLLNITLSDLSKLSVDMFDRMFGPIKQKIKGKLIVKEYPTAGASAMHFKALLNELALKKKFKPDIIFIDYLNICASSRIKSGGSENTYLYNKSISEELRGLGVEYNLPVVTATQTNRTGFSNSDPGMENTSDSFGVPFTADFMCALITNEDLEKLGQIMVKQLKNRYTDPNINKRFILGVDKAKMRLYNVNASQQTLVDSGQEVSALPNKFSTLKV